MKLRCNLDGLLLEACFCPCTGALIAFDGDEGFALEGFEAAYYQLVRATRDELTRLERTGFRSLRRAEDFQLAERALTPGRSWLKPEAYGDN